MGTKDVRLDPKLNQALWAQGIKTVPHRIRVKLEREYRLCDLRRSVCLMHISGKRNDEENAKEKLYTYASHVPVNSFKAGTLSFYHATVLLIFVHQGLQTTVADAE
jgi:large subunit ribosomal protein L31e